MTRSRQNWNAGKAAGRAGDGAARFCALARRLVFPAALAALVAVTLATGLAGPPPAVAGTTERIVTDPYTGLAIDGFDPVGYFVAGRPERGHEEYELRYQGASWRFANEGNRAQFAANPEVYAPRFGGYDPVELAEGKAVAGAPLLWCIHGSRLYLFSSDASRRDFEERPETMSAKAERAWPALSDKLAR